MTQATKTDRGEALTFAAKVEDSRENLDVAALRKEFLAFNPTTRGAALKLLRDSEDPMVQGLAKALSQATGTKVESYERPAREQPYESTSRPAPYQSHGG